MANDKYQIPNTKYQISKLRFFFVICNLIFGIFYLSACQALKGVTLYPFSAPEANSAATPVPSVTEPVPLETGHPPGPVLNIAPLPDGEFLAGVGPIGDVETGFEWRLYSGRDDGWSRLTWPPEAIPRSLHFVPSGDATGSGEAFFAVPFSNALFGRGQAWGLMRSTDGGRTWQQALNGLGDPYVMDLTLAPSSPDEEQRAMFAVTWYSGVYRSMDGGETWEPLPLEGEVEPSGGANPFDVTVAVSPDYGHPAGEGLLMASFSRGLRRWDSRDEAWQTIPLTVTATIEDFDPAQAQLTAGAIAFSPGYPEDGTIYLYSGYAGLFRSTDRGETWERVDHRLPLPPPFVTDFRLAVVSANEAYTLLDTGETDSRSGQPIRVLYRTLDGGKTWEALEDPPTQGWVSAFALGRDAEGRVVLHLGGSQGGVSSHLADVLSWD